MIEATPVSPHHFEISTPHIRKEIGLPMTHSEAPRSPWTEIPALAETERRVNELSQRITALGIPELQPIADTRVALHPNFNKQDYTFRRKIWKFLGGSFDVHEGNIHGPIVLHSLQDRVKLKENFHVYPSKRKEQEILSFRTEQRLDLWSKFDVTDPVNNEQIGSIRREWLQSGLQDTWTFLTPLDAECGRMIEERPRRAILSRLLSSVIAPQRYVIKTAAGDEVAKIKQWRNPIAVKYDMKIHSPNTQIDRRLLIAAGLLLVAVESQQPSSPLTGVIGDIVEAATV